ncbi:hypothetical protein RKE30_00715 [Streptomyces sp. Li-HN-5-11]|uniref:hypothetical protein n=1 Tax=Streptomyces sp. Li-HN-5-11 TaxID=3075432 RepID=UPI0028AC7B91|nr:hypothetical protein [Streptomyces sp. Li-HN-5-11]WNM29030.1 hypothetical protein RKE30_00715 [Streptomyces sp. Li-HN-5-11]
MPIPGARRKPPDPVRQEAFAAEVADVLDKAAPALLTSVGHQCRPFDTLAALPRSSSEHRPGRRPPPRPR